MALDLTNGASPDVDKLRAGFRGDLLEASHPAYDSTRMVWNGMIDRRPALIARCRDAADIAACVNYGRDHGLTIAVRGGGHNVAMRFATGV